MFRQYMLNQGHTTMVCWLDETALKVGTELTLKKVDGRWQVKEAYEPVMQHRPETDWQVGGIVGRSR